MKRLKVYATIEGKEELLNDVDVTDCSDGKLSRIKASLNSHIQGLRCVTVDEDQEASDRRHHWYAKNLREVHK